MFQKASPFQVFALLILISFFAAQTFYLFYEYVFSSMIFKNSLINYDTFKKILYFIFIISTISVIYYLCYLRRLKQRRIALNCTKKIGLKEYEEMIKTMTVEEVKKLEKTKEFKQYMREGRYLIKEKEDIHDDIDISDHDD